MATQIGGIYVDMALDSAQFQKGLNDAQRGLSGFSKSLGPMQAKFTNFGKTAFAGLVGGIAGLGVAGPTDQFRDVISGIADMNAEAKRAGLGVEAFQELRFAADQYRVSVSALTDGIKEMQLRSDEFIATGKGSAAEAFTRLGYTAADLKEKLTDPSALFTEIIGKLGELDRAAQIRVADEIFGGTGGEQFVQLIEAGEAGIKRTIEESRNLGRVLSEDVVAKGVELDKAINIAATSIGTTLQGAIVNAGWALYDFVQQFWDFESRTAGSLGKTLEELQSKRASLEAEISGARTDALDNAGLSPAIVSGTVDYVTATGLKDARAELAGIIAQEKEINAILAARNPAPPVTRETPIAPVGGGAGGGGSGGRGGSSRTSAIKDQAAEIIAALEAERVAIGLTSTEQRMLNALRAAGVDASSAQGQAIRMLVAEIEAEITAQDRLNEAIAEMEDNTKLFASTFVSELRSGASAADALNSALSKVADRLFDLALDSAISQLFSNLGGGAGGGILAGLFGGARAAGGPVSPGKAYLVGEKRPELFVPSSAGTIIPRLPTLAPGGQAPAASAGTSRVVVELSDGLEAKILKQAAGQSVAIVSRSVPRMISDQAPGAVAAANMRKRS